MSDVAWFAGWALASTVLMSPVPQEPVIFYGATLWPPLEVALAMTAASCVAAVIDFRLLAPLAGLPRSPLSYLRGRWFAASFVAAPFLSLVAINLLPIPLSPFKLICIANGYPLARFELALLLGRFPRYFLLASFGRALDLSVSQLILLAAAFLGVSYLQYRRPQSAQLEASHG